MIWSKLLGCVFDNNKTSFFFLPQFFCQRSVRREAWCLQPRSLLPSVLTFLGVVAEVGSCPAEGLSKTEATSGG